MSFNRRHATVQPVTHGDAIQGKDSRRTYRRACLRCVVILFGVLCSHQATAAPAPPLSLLPPVIPLHQELVAVDYFREGRPTGCGLRISGEAEENLWLNVLISVFLKETGITFGIFKVSAKKIAMKDGAPLRQDGSVIYSSIGKIHKAWLRTESGVQPNFLKNGEMMHADGYMASMEFASTMDMLVAIPQASFRVGFNRSQEETEEIYEFNKRIAQNEASKLFACMKNLRSTIEDNKSVKGS